MNILKRILIILLAAALVVGATSAVAQWSGSDSGQSEQSAPLDKPDFEGGEVMPTRPEGEDREAAGPDNFVEVVKNVVVFTVLFVAAMILNLLWNWLTKHWPRRRTLKMTSR